MCFAWFVIVLSFVLFVGVSVFCPRCSLFVYVCLCLFVLDCCNGCLCFYGFDVLCLMFGL